MFLRLARGVARHPVLTIMCWAALTLGGAGLAIFGLTGDGLFDRVSSGAPEAADSDSMRADQIVADGASSSQSITLAVGGVDLANAEQVGRLAAALAPVRQDLAAIDGIATRPDDGYPMVIDPLNPSFCADPTIDPAAPEAALCALANPAVQGLVATSHNGLLLTVDIAKDLDAAQEDAAAAEVAERLRLAAADLKLDIKGATAEVGGESLIMDEIISAMKHDLELGEMIALPVALAVMVLVFAGFLAASMPVMGAVASIMTCMGAVFGFSYLIDLHTSVVNVISLVGIGLSVDYGLLVVSRFREELRSGASQPPQGGPDGARPVPQTRRSARNQTTKALVSAAVIGTVRTAGRTVFYSALTIAVCIAGLMAFEPSILRTFGLAGLLVVLCALASATTLVPALLVLVGHRLARPSLLSRLPGLRRRPARGSDISPDQGVFSKLAGGVQKHPWLVMLGVLVVLGVLAAPARGLELRNSTVELLPLGSEQREFLASLERDYPATASDGIEVVAEGGLAETERFARDKLDGIVGVSLVENPDGTYATQMDGYVRVLLEVDGDDPEGPEARAAVTKVRAEAPGSLEIHVTGPAARLLDFEQQLADGAPTAAIIICLAVFILLFAFTGSVLIPLKALITNALSLLACLGVVTWVFQDGHLTSLLGFNAMSGIESYILVLLLIFGFGLAMDYEVFLISRIKEEWDADPDPQGSVRRGLQHSGRIITSAALIIVMVFLGFTAGDLVIIKEIGIGLAVAVTLDATLVRMLLVPATMTILGQWNWWAPKPLARLHAKLGLKD
ncbi:MAG: MMPL family transporter [Bifidobacteriaceae bacterium]|nr:MMPL family transporter [Bifidobacteriaceae bacterium]